MEIDTLRKRLDDEPGDDDARAAIAKIQLAAGDRDDAAEGYYLAACGARKRGRDDLFRQRLTLCLEARPDWPLVFLEPPAPAREPISTGARILVVHPESRVRGPVVRLLLDHGYLVDEAATVGSARAVLREGAPDLVLTAPELLDGDAFAIATAARRSRKSAAVVLLTCAARGEMTAPGDRVAKLVDEHLDRPLAPSRLLESVAAALWRQRHAVEVPREHPKKLEIPRSLRSLAGLAPLAGRTTVVVAAGYAVVFALHFWLESSPATFPDAKSESPARVATTPLPPELSADAEHILWTRLTSTERSADFELQVTSVTPDLVAARVYRSARRRNESPEAAQAAIERALATLAAADHATFEIRVSSKLRNFDALASARSARLELDGKLVQPIVTPAAESLRFVRESETEGDLRTRSLQFKVSFRRSELADSEVVGVRVELAGEPHVVYVARTQLGGA